MTVNNRMDEARASARRLIDELSLVERCYLREVIMANSRTPQSFAREIGQNEAFCAKLAERIKEKIREEAGNRGWLNQNRAQFMLLRSLKEHLGLYLSPVG